MIAQSLGEGPDVDGVCGVGDSSLAEVVKRHLCDCCYYCCSVCYCYSCCFCLGCLSCCCGCCSDFDLLQGQLQRVGTESRGAGKKGYQERDGYCRFGGDSYLSGDSGSGSWPRPVGLHFSAGVR